MNKRSAKVTRRGYLGVVLATLLWLPSLAQAVGLTLAVDKAGADVTTPITYTVDISCPSTEGTCTDAVVSVPLHTSVEYIGASNAVGNVQSIAYNASTHSVTITMNPTLNGTTDQVQLIVAFKGTTYTGTIANTTAYGAPTLQNPSNTVSTTATNGYAPPAFADRIDIGKSSGGINSTVMQGGYVQYRMSWSSKSQNEAINNLVLEDVLPANFNLTETYYNFYKASASAASIKTNLYYQTNTNTTYTLWPGSPFLMDNYNTVKVSALGLAAGEKVTKLKWEYLDAIPGTEFFNGPSTYIYGTLDADTPLGTLTNCLEVTAGTLKGNPVTVYDGQQTKASQTSCHHYTVLEPGLHMTLDKLKPYGKSAYLAGDVIDYQVAVGANSESVLPLTDAIVTDLLPAEVDYVSATTVVDTKSSVTPSKEAAVAVVPEIIPNYKGTGKTLLRWNYAGFTFAPNTSLRLNVKVTVKTGIPTGVINNEASITPQQGVFVKQISSNWNPPANFSQFTDADDLNGNGSTTDTVYKVTHPTTIVFPAGAGLESIKWVKGELDTDYSRFPNKGQTVPGGKADYKMTITNKGSVAMKDIKVMDILPFVGDKGVIDLNARNTQWRPFLIDGIKTSAADVKIYYSTAKNPCRDELTPGKPTDCEAPNWSETLPADIASVQALKFDFGATVMQPNDVLELSWSMRAPVDAPTNGEVAWNSFGYITSRNDNGTSLLPSEPIKVGIVIKPAQPASYGNYVWNDVNANGLQDEGVNSGLNNVRVDLYKALGATPDLVNDTLVSFTRTSDNKGEPGHYLFPNLPAGNYYAVFHQPDGYQPSTVNAGTDVSKDSDGTALTTATGIVTVTPITALAADAEDLSWDQGFVVPATSDFGDAPDTYKTTLASGGASHTLVTGVALGNTLDAEVDGQPSVGADGDGADEDGVVSHNAAVPGGKLYFTVLSKTMGHNVSAWIDWNGNGDWNDAGEQILNDSFGLNTPVISSVDVPLTAKAGMTYARFRVCDTKNTCNTPAGAAPNGEVEDYPLPIVEAASVGDYVWLDKNGDGIQDGTETGLQNVVVKLVKTDGTLADQTLTDATGAYRFNVVAGTPYYLEFINPSATGYTFTQQGAGTAATDSDSDPTTGRTATFTAVAGHDPHWDAGLIEKANTQTYCSSHLLSATNWTDNLVVKQFDPALGTLKNVDITSSCLLSQIIGLENTDSAAALVGYDTTAGITLTKPDGSTQACDLGYSQQFESALFDGVSNFAGVSGKAWINQPFYNSVVEAYTPVDGFVGTNTVTFPVVAKGAAKVFGAGNSNFSVRTQEGENVCVTYTYEKKAPVVDLKLSKVADKTTVKRGDTVIYTLTVTNESTTIDATGVKLVDTLPVGVTYSSDDGAGSYNKTTGEWTVDSLLKGDSKALNITVTVD